MNSQMRTEPITLADEQGLMYKEEERVGWLTTVISQIATNLGVSLMSVDQIAIGYNQQLPNYVIYHHPETYEEFTNRGVSNI